MTYQKQEWRNNDRSTPLSAERLLHMEEGIAAAHSNTGGGGGVAPHIGPNGNWWVGETDTGTPAQGPPGTGGGGGVNLVEDPPGSGLFVIGA